MKTLSPVRWLIHLLVILSLISCGGGGDDGVTIGDVEPTPVTPVSLNILTLGDSRVEGARPSYESYRYELWQNLVSNNWEFDLIGAFTDNATYPTFMNLEFDRDHNGTIGITTQGILNTLPGQLASLDADVVLLGVGGNDLLGFASIAQIETNLNQIIDLLKADNNQVIIFIEQIAPLRSDLMSVTFTNIFNDFNDMIVDVANAQNSSTSPVFVVDIMSNWSDDYFADTLHYNEAGAKEVADRYFIAMDNNITR